ncbi:hypothetical protein O6H91_10G041600 [Diphasiastrum complanatum]|nr:hypothetical protein O6H91_10G041600 [Diphasiastrum complanatum]
MINACCSWASLAEGRIVHTLVSKSEYNSDIDLRIALAKMYCKCNSPEDAHRLFDPISRRNVGLWTALIAFYAQKGDGNSAFHFFGQMQQEGVEPDKMSFLALLSACTTLAQGRMIHAGIVKRGFDSDIVIATALIKMYGQCGSIGDAKEIFEGMLDRNVVSWTSMIAAYIHHGYHKVALRLFQQMQQEGLVPDRVAYISILDACSSPAALTEGKLIHRAIIDRGLESDLVLGTALISMYGRCGSVAEARELFDKVPELNVVRWTAMITAYAQQGDGESALQIFEQMQQKGLQPTKITWVSVLDACASATCLDKGKLAHSHIIDHGLETDVAVGTALINMYGKCGYLDDAGKVFDKMPGRNVVTWNAIMAIHAQHGNGLKALHLFGLMQWVGIRPNNVTFLNVLYACIHAGLIDQGCNFFWYLKDNDDIVLDVEHYGCMIDLLVRAGQMDVAEDLVIESPFEHKDILWMTLLGARKLHECRNELAICK